MSLHRIDNRPIPRSGGKCRVFIVCNNEEERLPHFFDGHRHLGVQRFFAVDNNSADSPKDFLAKQRNWGKTPGKIVPNVDRSAPAQQGLAQSCGQRFVSGRMLRLGAWDFAPIAREVVDLFQALAVPPPILVQLLLRTLKQCGFEQRRDREGNLALRWGRDLAERAPWSRLSERGYSQADDFPKQENLLTSPASPAGRRHHQLGAGITGWAQVSGWRGRLDILRKLNEPVEHDVYHIRHWSLLLYRQILLRTMGCVFRDTSAV
ncbi:MAG: sugar transferase [Acetobacteraceae bacterium]|nr:sugar transferase [Acetobacteraceae bacterium]